MRLPVRSLSIAALATSVLPVAALSFAGCQETDLAKPATWIAKLGDKDPSVVKDALDNLRRMKAKEAAPQVVPVLKADDASVREAAAAALEDIGDASDVQPLIEAVDTSTSESATSRANSKIADALGTIGDKKATPELLKMLKTHDDLLRVHALEALDKIRDPASVPDLTGLVLNEDTAPLVTKWAIITLGDLRAPAAIPALARALVMERHGISFFVESSYALFQIGPPAVPQLTALLSGDDKDYVAWAASERRAPAGYASKAAIVLADIGDPSAIPALVKALKWSDPNENDAFTNLVRGKVAEALGRLRAQDAAAPLAAALAGVDDASTRSLYAIALAHIGDPKALPKMEAAAKNAKDSWTDRQETLTGIALLGDGQDKPLFEAIQKAETPEKVLKECLDLDSDEAADAKQARCKSAADNRVKLIADELARLMAGEQCHQDVQCWIGKLKDPSPKIRERAAFELGKLGKPEAIDALLVTCKDDSMAVRRAAYIALDWMTRVDAARPVLKTHGAQLAKQLEDEKSSAITQIVNEDLKRVVWKIQQT